MNNYFLPSYMACMFQLTMVYGGCFHSNMYIYIYIYTLTCTGTLQMEISMLTGTVLRSLTLLLLWYIYDINFMENEPEYTLVDGISYCCMHITHKIFNCNPK